MEARCPICSAPTRGARDPELTEEQRRVLPFCSARCKLVDLGNWLGERYAIPGERADRDRDDDSGLLS